jgi:hypothetical protein
MLVRFYSRRDWILTLKTKDSKQLLLETWTVRREGRIEELVDDLNNIRWRVTMWDQGRDQPFLVQYFASPESAKDFYLRVQSESMVELEKSKGSMSG